MWAKPFFGNNRNKDKKDMVLPETKGKYNQNPYALKARECEG